MSDKAMKKTALITGASSGIGAVYADRLARRGYDLILVARNEERLQALAARLASTGSHIELLVADLNQDGDLARVEAVLRENTAIDMLVNNAGVGAVTPLLDSDIGAMEAMIRLNVIAATRLVYAAVPGFVARRKGTLINIASVVAVAPEMLNGVYGATKAYVLALSQSLHKELAGTGVHVQVVLPGATATELWSRAGMPYENLPREIVMGADDMVDAALAGLDRGELVTLPALAEIAEWEAYEDARQAMMGHLSKAEPAPRYRPAEAL